MRGRARAGVALILCAPLSGCFSAPPQLVQLNPANGSTSVPANQPVRVYFDHPVDQASVATRFSVDPPLAGCDLRKAFGAAPGSPCWVEWTAAPEGFTFNHPGALFAARTHYTFHIASGFRDLTGVTNELDHTWDMTITPAPRLNTASPADGDSAVTVDTPLVVSFSAFMDGSLTAPAITLEPAIAGTHVVQSLNDPSRFSIIPGHLLEQNTDYALVIGAAAADRNGLGIEAATRVRFHTGGFSSDRRAAVLARRLGEGASEVDLSALSASQRGDPVFSVPVLSADRCAATSCGAVAQGGPLLQFDEPALSPDHTRLALVQSDLVQAGHPSQLVVYSLPSAIPRIIADAGAHPSWSPDGTQLCYGAPDGIHVLDLNTNLDRVFPPGAPLAAAAQWAADGATLALPVQPARAATTVELADTRLLLRYPVPGLEGQATAPRFSPDGRLLALRIDPVEAGSRLAAGTWIVSLRTGDPPRPLGADLTPLGWTDTGTLLAASLPGAGGTPQLLRMTVSTGDRAGVSGGPAASDLLSTALAGGGRQVVYLHADGAGVVQAWSEDIDGSAPAQLSTFAAAGLEAALVVA